MKVYDGKDDSARMIGSWCNGGGDESPTIVKSEAGNMLYVVYTGAESASTFSAQFDKATSNL